VIDVRVAPVDPRRLFDAMRRLFDAMRRPFDAMRVASNVSRVPSVVSRVPSVDWRIAIEHLAKSVHGEGPGKRCQVSRIEGYAFGDRRPASDQRRHAQDVEGLARGDQGVPPHLPWPRA